MNKDRAEGKVKDIAGRVQRQAGEWTDDKDAQAEGAMKQVEGKVQNAWGKAKDAAKDATEDQRRENKSVETTTDEDEERSRKAS